MVKERLKFSLMLSIVGMLLAALATWHFWNQIEFEEDRSRFLLSAVVTGTLGIAALGLLLFYLSAKRVMDPSHSFTDRFDNLPWWAFKLVAVLVVIGAAALFIIQHSDQAENEFELIRSGHLNSLEERIQTQPALLENKDARSGQTLLQVAYNENNPQAVKMLLEKGAAVTDLDADGRNPIIASLKNLPMLGALLDCGLNPETPDADGVSPIHHAVATDSAAALDYLLQAGAKVDSRDLLYRTPLMRAVEMDSLPMAGILLEQEAEVNAFDRRGDTALHIAVRRRNPGSISLLLENDADPRVFNFTHMTPLHIAALAGQTNLVSIFLEIPDMTGLHDDGDRTPLDLALQSRKYETATLLIEGGADINRINQDGNTLLHTAVQSKNYRTARFLIRAGASGSIPDKNGRTALDFIRMKQLSGLLDLFGAEDLSATNAVDSVEVP